MPSVYLSASVQEKNIGVVRIDGVTEEARMQALVKDIAPLLQARGVTVYLNKPEYSLAQIIYDSNAKKPDLHLALHTNAGGGSGTETWTYKLSGTNSFLFGKQLQAAVVKALGLPDRGLKDGCAAKLAEVVSTNATAALIELFFHDNENDLKTFNEKRKVVIDAVAKVVCNWFGIKETKTKEEEKIEQLVLEVAKLKDENMRMKQELKQIASIAAGYVVK